MASREDVSISIDLGGTKMRVAVIDRAGTLLQREEEPTLAHQGREQAVERLAQIIARLISSTNGREVIGIGASLASPVDPDTAIMYSPPNLPGWDGFSLKPLLEGRFGIPMWAVNDATLGAVGEHAYGIGRGVANLVYVTVSTGIGVGIITDGKPLLGARGFAAEIGHMVIDKNGPPCGCGNTGCLEALASGTAIANMALERLERSEESILQEMANGDPTDVNAKTVMEAAAQGDSLAVALVDQFARDLGLGLVNLMHIFDPQMIILGGGVSQSYQVYSNALDAAIRGNVMAHLREHINVVTSVLGDDVSLLGAAHLAFQRGGRDK
jgi:glucokinase